MSLFPGDRRNEGLKRGVSGYGSEAKNEAEKKRLGARENGIAPDQAEPYGDTVADTAQESRENGYTKRAWVRDAGQPEGQPGTGRIRCPCGNAPESVFGDGKDVNCPCGRKYDSRGNILAGPELQNAATCKQGYACPGKCEKCGAKFDGSGDDHGHYDPLKKGGTNLRVVCDKCATKDSAKDFENTDSAATGFQSGQETTTAQRANELENAASFKIGDRVSHATNGNGRIKDVNDDQQEALVAFDDSVKVGMVVVPYKHLTLGERKNAAPWRCPKCDSPDTEGGVNPAKPGELGCNKCGHHFMDYEAKMNSAENASDWENKPMAAAGNGQTGAERSYRYPSSLGGWIMIGASDTQDALREANRSLSTGKATVDKLQKWDGSKYASVRNSVENAHKIKALCDGCASSAGGKPTGKMAGAGIDKCDSCGKGGQLTMVQIENADGVLKKKSYSKEEFEKIPHRKGADGKTAITDDGARFVYDDRFEHWAQTMGGKSNADAPMYDKCEWCSDPKAPKKKRPDGSIVYQCGKCAEKIPLDKWPLKNAVDLSPSWLAASLEERAQWLEQAGQDINLAGQANWNDLSADVKIALQDEKERMVTRNNSDDDARKTWDKMVSEERHEAYRKATGLDKGGPNDFMLGAWQSLDAGERAALSRTLSNAATDYGNRAPEFIAWVKQVASANGKSESDVFKMWKDYSAASYDQSALTSEFMDANRLKGTDMHGRPSRAQQGLKNSSHPLPDHGDISTEAAAKQRAELMRSYGWKVKGVARQGDGLWMVEFLPMDQQPNYLREAYEKKNAAGDDESRWKAEGNAWALKLGKADANDLKYDSKYELLPLAQQSDYIKRKFSERRNAESLVRKTWYFDAMVITTGTDHVMQGQVEAFDEADARKQVEEKALKSGAKGVRSCKVVKAYRDNSVENAARFERPCPDCGGMAYVEDAKGNDVKCSKCKGTGVEQVSSLKNDAPLNSFTFVDNVGAEEEVEAADEAEAWNALAGRMNSTEAEMRAHGVALKNAEGDTFFCPKCRAVMTEYTMGVHNRANPTHSVQRLDVNGNLVGAVWAVENASPQTQAIDDHLLTCDTCKGGKNIKPSCEAGWKLVKDWFDKPKRQNDAPEPLPEGQDPIGVATEKEPQIGGVIGIVPEGEGDAPAPKPKPTATVGGDEGSTEGVSMENANSVRCSCGGTVEAVQGEDDRYECDDCGQLYEKDDWSKPGNLKLKPVNNTTGDRAPNDSDIQAAQRGLNMISMGISELRDLISEHAAKDMFASKVIVLGAKQMMAAKKRMGAAENAVETPAERRNAGTALGAAKYGGAPVRAKIVVPERLNAEDVPCFKCGKPSGLGYTPGAGAKAVCEKCYDAEVEKLTKASEKKNAEETGTPSGFNCPKCNQELEWGGKRNGKPTTWCAKCNQSYGVAQTKENAGEHKPLNKKDEKGFDLYLCPKDGIEHRKVQHADGSWRCGACDGELRNAASMACPQCGDPAKQTKEVFSDQISWVCPEGHKFSTTKG